MTDEITNSASSATIRAEEIDRLCIDTIRVLAMDAVQRANSGHPGCPAESTKRSRWRSSSASASGSR